MTYSIVARDALSGDLGVGVQTHQPSVGAIVPWVRGGLGAVATQSFANINFGPQALALLEAGLRPEKVLAAILAADDQVPVRQVAIIDANGVTAVHTGERCIPFASHVQGAGFSAQANMMTNEGVPEAMAAAFEGATGPLAARILAALDAGEAAGGDIRGRQSAAILVRGTGELEHTWDLRIDQSAAPLDELRALVNIRLSEAMLPDAGTPGTFEESMAAFEGATELAGSDEMTFWFAVGRLVELDRLNEGAQLLLPLFQRAPHWKDLLDRLELPGAVKMREHLDGSR